MKSAPATEIAKAIIRAHGVGVQVDEENDPKARPSTWDRWHRDELADWKQRLQNACGLVASAQNECRAMALKRDRWRLAAVFGWGFVALLLLAGIR